MQIAQAGVALPFEVTYYESDLFVGMVVLDVSTGTPVQVGDVIPMEIAADNTYFARFTPSNGKAYVVVKSVYTDDTYETIDTEYAAGSESFYAMYLTPVQDALVGVVEC